MEQLLIRTVGAALIAAILIWGTFGHAQQPQQQSPSAAQILGQQAAALLTQNAELIERIGKLQQELAAVTKERDELKAKHEPSK